MATNNNQERALRRLHLVSLHLLTPSPCAATASIVAASELTEELKKCLRIPRQEDRDKAFEFFKSRPELLTPVDISLSEHRELVFRQLTALVKDAGFRLFQYLSEDIPRFVAVFDAAGRIDASLGVKIGVQCGLWGASVINLGTQKHWDKYFEKIDSLEYTGCFAMTELHHGSNVQGLQTTAEFDPSTDEFIINTPNDGAIKWWIGNAALHGKFATVFARLILPNKEDMGIHAFVVPIRDLNTLEVLPGVEIQDCGHKVGLNGVDNGALKFNSVRIPRDNLLNKFGDVTSDGEYKSSMKSSGKRFAAMLGELVGGRVGIAYSSMGMLKVGVTIAVRYALFRQQFGPPKKSEISILDYQSHQSKLMPMLASAYAFHFACVNMVQSYSSARLSGSTLALENVHSLTSGLKSYISSYTARSLSICREACGGHGYAAVNRLGMLRNDHDIFQTFEGDNTVLLQQVATELLKKYKEKFQGGAVVATMSYLKESMNSFLSQPSPLTARWEGEDHLRDPKFQLDAFRYRTSKLLHSAAMRLAKHTKEVGSFAAWNRCLNHLLALAESHVESIILATFVDRVQNCSDPKARAALKLACDVYALDRIRLDVGTYRNQDYLAPNKAKAINKLTENLCYQMRCMAKELVDAFDFPDHVIRAPIALQSEGYDSYTQGVGF